MDMNEESASILSTMYVSETLTVPTPISDIFNTTEIFSDELLAEYFGPKRDNLSIVIPITVIYVIIFLTGIIGNVSTCIVIDRNKSMHTATNFYLFSLAISDLLLLISGLPQEVWSIWSRYPYVFGDAFCKLRGLFSETSANATVLTIAAFTVERYVAICHPFFSHTIAKLSRVVKLIVGIWIVAVCCAIPQALQFGIQIMIEGQPKTVMCHVVDPIIEHSFEVSTFLFFVTPMTLISVLYALIGLQLRNSTMMKRGGRNSNMSNGSAGVGNRIRIGRSQSCSRKLNRQQHGQSSRRVLKMLVAVVVAFFLCWAPFHAQRLMAIYAFKGGDNTDDGDRDKFNKIYDVLTYISGVLYYVSATINPLLYNIMSNKFREAFKETLRRWCCRSGCCSRRRLASSFQSGRGGAQRCGSGGCQHQYDRHQRTYSVLSRSGDAPASSAASLGTQQQHQAGQNGCIKGKRWRRAEESASSNSGDGRVYSAASSGGSGPGSAGTTATAARGGRDSTGPAYTSYDRNGYHYHTSHYSQRGNGHYSTGTNYAHLHHSGSVSDLGHDPDDCSTSLQTYVTSASATGPCNETGGRKCSLDTNFSYHVQYDTDSTNGCNGGRLSLSQSNGYIPGKKSLENRPSLLDSDELLSHWPRDRSDICLTMIPKTNLDTITPNMKLVAVHVTSQPKGRLSRILNFVQLNFAPRSNKYTLQNNCKRFSIRSHEYTFSFRRGNQYRGGLRKNVSDISNSSLRDVECGALEDELSAYMQEIKMREMSG